MNIVCLHDRDTIEAFLRRDSSLHLYEIGDLDDFFWEYTTWYALKIEGTIRAAALVYTGVELPVVLALANDPAGLEATTELVKGIRTFLPARFYAHFSPGLEALFAQDWAAESHGVYDKMTLADRAALEKVDTSHAEVLTCADRNDLERLYAESYPGNWFDPRMLETGLTYGVRGPDGSLVSVAGIHVYSPRYRIGVLGNITTHPDFRGQGLGAAVTAALCKALLQTVDIVGLNVRSDNAAAVACYRKLGFVRFAGYQEFMLTHR